MIKELVSFTETLREEGFLNFGLKLKEGLHILITIKNEDNGMSIDKDHFKYSYTKQKHPSAAEVALQAQFAVLSHLSWCVNTNKCFDLPIKAIHSCSPFCLALKRENLSGGEKYTANSSQKKSQVYERINAYFEKAGGLSANERQKKKIELFRDSLNTEKKCAYWLNQIPSYKKMKDSEYVIFYLNVPEELYQQTNNRYLADKLFNTNEYNTIISTITYGTSGFFNSFSIKKPYLSHHTASYHISARITLNEAKGLYEFQEMMDRNLLPKPLPIFIDNAGLAKESTLLFRESATGGKRMNFQQIIENLYDKHKDDFRNYYLLYYNGGEIKDYEYVSKFDYQLIDNEGNNWKVQDFFKVNYQPTIKTVFDFQHFILVPVFNNGLVVKTKTELIHYHYFDEIEVKYCKSENTYLLIMQYRKAFYDFVYKSKQQAVTQQMFGYILKMSVLDDVRLDEFINGRHTQAIFIRQKLNIWFSLFEKFNWSQKNEITMASKLQAHREFIIRLTKGEVSIETEEQYAFTVGQVIGYLLSKRSAIDKSYKFLEPFLQQSHSRELNKAIARMFDMNKHETFSANFCTPFAEVLDYETKDNVREYMPIILAGIFSKNALFNDREGPNLDSEIEE